MPKRDGGLRTILDLRPINRALGKRPFRMLTLKQILAQIRPGDWFASVDLKDAYFHIQIAPHHRRFSEVCCQGKAQRTNTLFSVRAGFDPTHFSKCIDAALPHSDRVEGASSTIWTQGGGFSGMSSGIITHAPGMCIQNICLAAGWSLQNTFARFYKLDVQSLASQVLSVSN